MIARELKQFVIFRDGNVCRYCWSSCLLPEHALTIDHVDPVARGGADIAENLVVSCQPCNNNKGQARPKEIGWRLLPPLPLAAHEQLIRVFARLHHWKPSLLADALDHMIAAHPDATYPAWMPCSVRAPRLAPNRDVEPIAAVALARRRVRVKPGYRVATNGDGQ